MRTLAVILVLFFTQTASAAVFINEIAWMGTTDSPSNEWMELANAGSTSIDMAGWVLSIEGKKDIALSGSISAGGFYLIERTDDTTVPSIAADLIAAFGTGLANTGAILSLKNASGAVADRVDGSQAWNIGGVVAGNNTTKETAQKGMTGWTTGTPTPRVINVGVTIPPAQEPPASTSTISAPASVSSNNSSFPIEPQIVADAGSAARTVSTGAQAALIGRVFGLKKEPIENARMVWSFGDGAYGEGSSVSHTYYYPGDYIAVLDVASGHFSASDRIAVHVIAPLIAIRTGGDFTRSFVAVENRGTDETDLSLWQVEAQGKIFIFPQNTILGARKTLTLASEVTGLVTSQGSVALLRFPNGTHVDTLGETIPAPSVQAPAREVVAIKQAEAVVSPRTFASKTSVQEASIASAFVGDTSDASAVQQESGSLWPWYIGAAFLGVLALLGLRMTRWDVSESPKELTAGDFEIVEDEEPKGSIF